MIDLDRSRMPFAVIALAGWLLVFVASFLPWFVEPDGSGPNAFGLPASILIGSVDEAFAGAGALSIGLLLADLGALGLATALLRRIRLVGAAGALLAVACALDYAFQMARSVDF